jgi:hypothetical protein
VIQASHVSTGTTNNALALNPSGGNVGIGTTTPGNGYSTTIPNARLSILNSGEGANVKSRLSIGGGASHYAAVEGEHTTNGATTLSFMTCLSAATNSANPETRMFIAADGNVGIGTTAPSAKLGVNGGMSVNGDIYMGPGYRNFALSGGNSNGYLYGAFGKYGDGIHLGYNFYNNNTSNVSPNPLGGTSRLTFGFGTISMFTGFPNIEPTNLGLHQRADGNVGIGTTTPSATLQVNGSLAKSSGTFDIGHPLYPDTNKRLVHSFIEGPRCDLIYRGKTTLINGTAVVNIDKECTQSPECAMDEGTFEALCDNPQIFLQNNQSFDRVRGVIAGATLTITCETPAAVEIEWMVIAERADPFIKQWDRTNPDGYLITQYSSVEAPVAPAAPVAPVAPSDPVAPADPVAPSDPAGPAASSE